jgi:hypothetical protein
VRKRRAGGHLASVDRVAASVLRGRNGAVCRGGSVRLRGIGRDGSRVGDGDGGGVLLVRRSLVGVLRAKIETKSLITRKDTDKKEQQGVRIRRKSRL